MTATLQAEVRSATVLRFDDGEPVRAASEVTAYRDGWLVVQDDATSGAWWVGDAVRRVRVFPPVEGHEVFGSDQGTKHLKPDLEAGCPVPGGVLLLGSGSSPRRMRGRCCAGRTRRWPWRTWRRYLGTADGVALAVTDALALDDGTVLVSAAAESAARPPARRPAPGRSG